MPAEPEGASAGEKVLAASLRLAYVPVVILLLAAVGAFCYAIAVFVDSARKIIEHPFPVSHQVGLFLLDIDLVLIGATMLIAAVGFYELFIREPRDGAAASVPAWLQSRDINDLKARVLAMIVLVLSVSFAEVVVDSPGGRQVLELGGGIALVIISLTAFIRLTAGVGASR